MSRGPDAKAGEAGTGRVVAAGSQPADGTLQPTAPSGATADPWSDPWADLRRHTPARIALGRTGGSLPTAELLRFAAAHAQARDAVHVPLDVPALAGALQADGWAPPLQVRSQAATRDAYLRRPDAGRRLDADSVALLQAAASGPVDLALVVADGLSAVGVQRHAPGLLLALRSALQAGTDGPPLSLAPLVLATQARVALADEIGALLQARVVLIALGERPGLSAPDSVGLYLTHGPRVGRSDAERNCISNVRPDGLPLQAAAARAAWLLREALRRRLSGVALKDDSAVQLLPR